jgi:shikimate kinase
MHLHNGVTVRLHGDSELLARRVLADGVEKRPLLSGDTGGEEQPTIDSIVAKINALLETRETMYKQADITVPLGARDDADGAPVDVVVDRLLTALEERVEADAVQNKLHNEPREGDITVTDPRGELGPRPERPGP